MHIRTALAICCCNAQGGTFGLVCREVGGCEYVTEEESCGMLGGAALESLPELRLHVQASVPFKATAVELGSRLGVMCPPAGGG